MSLTDDLYREIILEHFREPRNDGRLNPADLAAHGVNPFCGDDLEITARVNGAVITQLMSHGKGCSISQASASMMTEALKDKPLEEAERLARAFKEFMLAGPDANGKTLPAALEDLEVLAGVKKYPVRIKCAILAWNAFLDGVEQYRTAQAPAPHPSAGGQAAAPGVPADPAAAQEFLRTALKSVIDPELNMNIMDLGLVYGVDLNTQGQARVTYTLTSPGCPLGPVIQSQIQGALQKIPWVTQVQCHLVWTPPWDPKTMASEDVKMELGIW